MKNCRHAPQSPKEAPMLYVLLGLAIGIAAPVIAYWICGNDDR